MRISDWSSDVCFPICRKIRVTKVPFSTTAKAVINAAPRGFVKIVSDPATGVVIGGSIVGPHAAELTSAIALAATAGLKVEDLVDSLLVHPRSEEPTAESLSLIRIPYDDFCLKKKNTHTPPSRRSLLYN